MKKLISSLFMVALMFCSTNAFSYTFIDSYWNLNAVDSTYFPVGTGDGITEAFYQISYYAQTLSTITASGAITDVGQARATALGFLSGNDPADDEGFRTLAGYGFTFVWDDLEGQVTYQDENIIQAIYTGGTISLYIDYDPYNTQVDVYSAAAYASLTDGLKVGEIEITGGGYQVGLDGVSASSYTLLGKFTSLLEGFWFDAATDQDLSGQLIELGWLLAYSHGDNDPAEIVLGTDAAGNLTVWADHDASMQLAIVPEPSTIILLGAGLLGLGVVARRRK